MLPEEDQTTTTDNMQKIWVKIGRMFMSYVSEETNR